MHDASKKRTAQLLLFSLLLESCYNPNIGTGKKALPAPAGAPGHTPQPLLDDTRRPPYTAHLPPQAASGCGQEPGPAPSNHPAFTKTRP